LLAVFGYDKGQSPRDVLTVTGVVQLRRRFLRSCHECPIEAIRHAILPGKLSVPFAQWKRLRPGLYLPFSLWKSVVGRMARRLTAPSPTAIATGGLLGNASLYTPGVSVPISVRGSVHALIPLPSTGSKEADRAALPLAAEHRLEGDIARGPHGPEPPPCDTPAPYGDVGGLCGGSGPVRVKGALRNADSPSGLFWKMRCSSILMDGSSCETKAGKAAFRGYWHWWDLAALARRRSRRSFSKITRLNRVT
jgi:hypothetical protein